MGIFSTLFGADELTDAARQNKKDFRDVRGKALSDIAPYKDAGTNGLKAYLDSIGLGDSAAAIAAFQNSPEYQLNYNTALDEGTKGVTDVAQATGTYNSGRTLKALQDRAQQTSRGFFGDYLKGLSGITDLGYNAAGRTAGLRGEYADRIAGASTEQGNARASQYAGMDQLVNTGLQLAGSFVNPFSAATSLSPAMGSAFFY